jgi:ssDNA-binding replication factor A large subunit
LLDAARTRGRGGAGGGARRAAQPIHALNPYNNGWTIKARVANKGQMRTFEKNGASTSLFSVELVDEQARPRARLLPLWGAAPLAGLHTCSAHRRTVSRGA